MGIYKEWLNEGDKVITAEQNDYFSKLIAFRYAHEDLWKKWNNKPNYEVDE